MTVWVKVTQSCPTLWDSMDCPSNSPGQNTGVGSLSLLQRIFPTRDRTQVSHIVGRFFTSWATREAQECWSGLPFPSPGDLSHPGIEPRDRTQVSCIVGRFFTNWATRELLWSVFISIHFIYLMIWCISVIVLNLCRLPKTDSLGLCLVHFCLIDTTCFSASGTQ